MSVLNLGRYPPTRLMSLAQLQEACGYETFWYADERFFREVYTSLTWVGCHTQYINVGTMVTDPYSRHPALTAMALATLDEVVQGRAVLGLGAGVAGFRELRIVRRQPAQAMRETVAVIQALLRGETVNVQGEVIALDHCRLDFQPLRSQVPIYIASNGPMGLALAGELAVGAVMQGPVATPLVDWFQTQVHRGAQRVGRDLAEVDLVARVNVCVHEDPRMAKDIMRPTIARSLLAQAPNFTTFALAGLEIPSRLKEMVTALSYTHDPQVLAPIAALVPDDFVDALTLAGTVDDVAASLVRMAQHGVRHIMISPIAVEGDVESVVRNFAQLVMPRVRQALPSDSHCLR
jgi:5,10-methylenetetrahydromethanopterin reductase